MQTTQNIETLVLECKRYGSYYTAQRLLGFIDNVLINTRNIGYTIKITTLKNKIMNTNLKETNLDPIYQEILNLSNTSKMKSAEISQLYDFVRALQEKSIY